MLPVFPGVPSKSRDPQPRGGGTSATACAGRRIPDVAPRKIAAARALLRHRPAYCIPMLSAVTAESRVRGLPGGFPGKARDLQPKGGGTSATARAGRRIPDVAPRKIAAARLFSQCSPCSPVSPAKAGTRNREGVERQLQPVQGEGSQTLHPERLQRPVCYVGMLKSKSQVATEVSGSFFKSRLAWLTDAGACETNHELRTSSCQSNRPLARMVWIPGSLPESSLESADRHNERLLSPI